MRRLRAVLSPARVLLAAIVAGGLGVRVWNNDYGLPYVYNVDEGSHFTNRAVEMFAGDPNPGYFQNPSGFTYLVHLVLRLRYGHGWPFGDFDGVVRLYAVEPSSIYVVSRTLAAVLCMLGVAGVYYAGKRLWSQREGLVAAALLSFAFLPVAYSRIAVTDVGTLLPVALAVLGAVRVHERGARSDYLMAGAASGLAVGFKYTAGLVLLPLLAAAALRARREPRAVLEAGLALVAGALAFLATTPYLLLDFDTARRQIEDQAAKAGAVDKVGQRGQSGLSYYLRSLTWGLGWAGALAALGGAAIELRRSPTRALLLVLFPAALLVYLATQSRYFGRWLLPAYPVLALLASACLVRLVDLARLRPVAQAAALALGTALALAQPVMADVRSARVLGLADTRQEARDFLVQRYRRGLRIVIEPAVPGRYYRVLRPQARRSVRRKQFVRGYSKDIAETRIQYPDTLRPDLIDSYRATGYCLVMTMSVIRGRAERDRKPDAMAYYRRLEDESELVFRASPYRPGADPVPFHFDLSYNYYPSAFERPGPEVRIYRLRACRQRYGHLSKAERRLQR